jgi:TolB protein
VKIVKGDKSVLLLALFVMVLMLACEGEKSAADGAPGRPPLETDVTDDILPIDGPPTGDIVFDAEEEIYALSDNATGYRRLTRSGLPNYSPSASTDGSAVYYVCGLHTDLCRVKPDGTTERVMTGSTLGVISDPAVSPDREAVLLVGGLSKDLYLYILDTRALVPVTADTAGDSDPSWTPTGGLVWERSGSIVSAPASQVGRLISGRRSGTISPTTLADGRDPDVSPDGTKIAFMRGNPAEIWTMGIDGSDQQARTTTPFDDEQPSWSPNGTKIAYTRLDQVGESFSELYIMNADGSGVRRMTTTDNVRERNPDWTDLDITASLLPPDCAEEDPGCVHSVLEGDSGNTPLEFQVKLTEKPGTQLTVNFRIVAGSAVANVDYVPPVTQTLTFGPNEDLKTFSVAVVGDTIDEPDESFYVTLLPSTGVELGTARRQASITDDDEAPSPSPSPTVGPTGPGAIAYQSGGGEVWVMKPDGTDQHKLTDGAAPDWKPDGSQIAFFDPASPDPDIFQIPPTGGAPTPVNGTSTFDGSPSWAPDGSGISWTNLGAGAPDVYKAEPPGGTPTPVLNTAAAEFNQDWDVLHDGTEVMAVVKDSAIILVNPDTGAQIGPVLVPASESANNPAISPDGTKIAYNSSLHGDPDIFVLDLVSGGPAAHLTTSSAEDVAPTWSPDGTMLAFQTNRDGNFEIYTMDAATGSAQTNITNTPGNEVEAAWGPAGTAAVIRAVTDAVDESPSDQEEPSSIAPSHGGRSSSGNERGVGIAIPGMLLGSWFLSRRRKKLPPS